MFLVHILRLPSTQSISTSWLASFSSSAPKPLQAYLRFCRDLLKRAQHPIAPYIDAANHNTTQSRLTQTAARILSIEVGASWSLKLSPKNNEANTPNCANHRTEIRASNKHQYHTAVMKNNCMMQLIMESVATTSA
ncbi:hypothetical protein FPOAC2_07284 [Fusarium poae]